MVQIYLNLRKCELRGIVSPGTEPETQRDEIIEGLCATRGLETYEPLVQDICR